MRRLLRYLILLGGLAFSIVILINLHVIGHTNDLIMEEDQLKSLSNVDCIIILGAGVYNDRPSPMLKDRLNAGIYLYHANISDKIIVSGDHGNKDYDEVNIMKKYAIENEVASNDIFMDHAGFSTYESIYRAKEVFKAEKVIIVSQKYHLFRALYIARKLGIEAFGFSADAKQYSGAYLRELREVLARNKDFFKCIYKPKPTYLGEVIEISGDGNLTNDDD